MINQRDIYVCNLCKTTRINFLVNENTNKKNCAYNYKVILDEY